MSCLTEIHDGAPDRFSLAVLHILKNDVKTISICHELKQLPCSNQNLRHCKTTLKSEIRILKTYPLNPFSFRFKFRREISTKMLVSFSS